MNKIIKRIIHKNKQTDINVLNISTILISLMVFIQSNILKKSKNKNIKKNIISKNISKKSVNFLNVHLLSLIIYIINNKFYDYTKIFDIDDWNYQNDKVLTKYDIYDLDNRELYKIINKILKTLNDRYTYLRKYNPIQIPDNSKDDNLNGNLNGKKLKSFGEARHLVNSLPYADGIIKSKGKDHYNVFRLKTHIGSVRRSENGSNVYVKQGSHSNVAKPKVHNSIKNDVKPKGKCPSLYPHPFKNGKMSCFPKNPTPTDKSPNAKFSTPKAKNPSPKQRAQHKLKNTSPKPKTQRPSANNCVFSVIIAECVDGTQRKSESAQICPTLSRPVQVRPSPSEILTQLYRYSNANNSAPTPRTISTNTCLRCPRCLLCLL